jgi:NAD(P)H-hydrate epimerase
MRVKNHLPSALYRAEQVRALDCLAIESFALPGAVLMERAGAAVVRQVIEHWADAEEVIVLCGVGNNGGDGYVVARLAKEAGYRVRLFQLSDRSKLQGDARLMADAFHEMGGEEELFHPFSADHAVIVDAILGTGLERPVEGRWADVIHHINHLDAPVVAVDIPSGLHADSGRLLGVAVEADITVSFIALKQGMFTSAGPECCGEIYFDSLDIPRQIYRSEAPAAYAIDWSNQSALLKPRRQTVHKGDCGHVLVVGGAPGFSGAVRMAAEAAARSGAGLVSVATHPEHAALLNQGRPELMVHAVLSMVDLQPLLECATVVALGPGLSCSDWGRELYSAVLASSLPIILDADGLNLLAESPSNRANWVLTPHPGEAARLLGCNSSDIQNDRFSAVAELQRRYGGVAVLKGAGTLIQPMEDEIPLLCRAGNPGMASGGMGDLLTGIIAAFIAQGLPQEDAASAGVALHSEAADLAAEAGERGMLATDLLPSIRQLLNGG